MLDVSEIKRLIDEDRTSEKKAKARIGQNYYEGLHDILDYKIYQYDSEGRVVENKHASNIKIAHRFFAELVDQQVQYMLSGEDFIKCDNQELKEQLEVYFDDDFISELKDCITCVCVNGFGYMYAYWGEDSRLHFMNANAMDVVEVRAKDTDDNCDYVIYYYTEKIAKLNKRITHIEVWDNKQTYYYVQENDGEIKFDDSMPINPRPHIIYQEGTDLYYNGLGFIPFFRMDNGKKQLSEIWKTKAIIDDYDLMSCALSNNLQDFNEALYVIKGFKGDNFDELATNISKLKRIGVPEGGDVDIKTITIPYEARKIKIDQNKEDIYKFGMGFDSSKVGDGNITNIVIKSRYALLDMKCDKLETYVKKFLRKLLRVVLDEINENNTAYEDNLVRFEFERKIMTNALDNEQEKLICEQQKQTKINYLISASSILGEEIIAEKMCEVLDINYNEVKNKIPQSIDELETRLNDEKEEEI